jgi:RND family efflux transporter MFP subunit
MFRRIARRAADLIKLGLLGGVFCISATVAAPVSVRTLPLGELLVEPQFSAPATVMARNQPQVAAEIDARVTAFPVQVGDHVSADATLARLDCRSDESRLAVARAELKVTLAQMNYAREQLTRARNLKKNDSISDELLDQRRTDLEARQAEADARREAVKQAAINVGHCEIRAPFDAVVTERLVSIGSFVSRGTAIVGLLEMAGQEISASLRQNEIARLQQAEELVFEAASGRFPVRLRALLPALDTLARTREARLAFVSDAALPGTAGRLVWQVGRKLLPADYLVRRDNRLGVFVLNGDRAQFIVIPHALEGQPCEVDLPSDTRLITDGRQSLVDGQAVAVSPPREQPW